MTTEKKLKAIDVAFDLLHKTGEVTVFKASSLDKCTCNCHNKSGFAQRFDENDLYACEHCEPIFYGTESILSDDIQISKPINYFETKLINGDKTCFEYNDQIFSSLAEDGQPLFSMQHTTKKGFLFSNKTSDKSIINGMLELYRNSLNTNDPTIPDTIIASKDTIEALGEELDLKTIEWDSDNWVLFNSHKGISERWWTYYGYFPNK